MCFAPIETQKYNKLIKNTSDANKKSLLYVYICKRKYGEWNVKKNLQQL